MVTLIVVFGFGRLTVSAGSGSIPDFRFTDNQLNGVISVTCPGSTGFDWRVGVDDPNNVHVEQTTSGGGFRLDGSRIGNGHHNAIAQVHCSNESWNDATTSTVGFDWYGGNPTPAPPITGYEVSISFSVSPTSVSPGATVGTTISASCSNDPSKVDAVKVSVNGTEMNQLGSPVMTWSWTAGSSGQYVFLAQARCKTDMVWKTVASAQATVTVQQGAPSSGGSSTTGTAGNQVPQNDTSSNGFSQYRLGSNGLDVQRYCQGKFGRNAINDGANATSWGCDGVQINHDAVCQDIWGSERPYAWLQGGLAGWTCEQSPQPGASNNQPASNSGSNSNQGSVQDLSGYGSAPAGQWVKVITGKINMRSGPGVNYDVKAKFPYGSYLDYKSTSNGWYEVSYNGVTGWVSGGSAYTQRGSGPDTVTQAPVGPAKPQNPPQKSSCGSSHSPRLTIGQKGRSIYTGADQMNLRAYAGTSYVILTRIPYEGIFTVLTGPQCVDGFNWWNVDFGGTLGWVAEGGNGEYWLEPYTSPQKAAQQPGPIASSVVTQIDFPPWGTTYPLVVNTSTCLIENGADISAKALSDFAVWNNGKTPLEIRNYFAVNVGQTEQFRIQVEMAAKAVSGCTMIKYAVGPRHTMDTSGLGNMLFGFFSATYPALSNMTIEEVAAGILQATNSNTPMQFFDFKDDRIQRYVGRWIAENYSGRLPILPNLVILASEAYGLE